MRARTIIWLVVIAVSTSGCYTKKTYNKLLAKHDLCQDTLSKKEAYIVEIQDEIQRLTAERKKLLEEKAQILKDKTNLQGSVEEMQKALKELERRKAEVDKRLSEFRGFLARFQSMVDAGKLRVKIVKGRMVVELASDILFNSGSANLGKEGRATIEEVAVLLASIPVRSFQVEGHTDDVPIRTAQFPSNWELSTARAVTVVKTMIAVGMPPARISASGYSETQPAVPNTNKESRSANRRIEIVVVPDLSTMPGFDELQKLNK
ncbi:MAG: OmpA family protein [Pseudomonadota bacterium]